MILIGLGANLPSERGKPVETLSSALAELAKMDVVVERRSRWFESSPVPPSDQSWFVNAVAAIATSRPPDELLRRLHAIESLFGRIRTEANAARPIDLDLLDYEGRVITGWPILPHPRLHERGFVLYPLQDVAPGWRHPETGRALTTLLSELPAGQIVRPLEIPDDLP